MNALVPSAILTIRSARVTLFAQTISYIIQALGAIVLARLLTPSDFGLVGMALAVITIFQNFGFNGLTEVIIQSKDLTHQQLSNLFWISLSLGFALSVFVAALSPIIAAFFVDERLVAVTVVMAPTVLLTALATVPLAALKREMRFERTSTTEVFAATAGILAAIVLVKLGCGYWALVARWLVSPVIMAGLGWMLVEWRPGCVCRDGDIRDKIRFAVKVYATFAVDYLRKNVDRFLIGRYLGAESLGSYERALHLGHLLPAQLVSPLANVFVSAVARYGDDVAKQKRVYLQAAGLLAFAGVPIGLMFYFCADDIVLVLLGPKWRMSGEILSIVGPALSVLLLYQTQSWLHLISGCPGRWLGSSIVSLAVFGGAIVSGLRFGVEGVAWAISLSLAALTFPSLLYAGRSVGLRLGDILSAVGRYYMAGLLAGGGYAIVVKLAPPAYVGYIFRAALLSGIYLTLVCALERGPVSLRIALNALLGFGRRRSERPGSLRAGDSADRHG